MFAKLSNNRKLEEATSTKDDVAPSMYPGCISVICWLHACICFYCSHRAAWLHPMSMIMLFTSRHELCVVRISKHWACSYCLDSSLLSAAADLLPAVYLLDEIAGLAGSGGEVAQGMADTTIRRLGHRSPVVKLKVGSVDKLRPSRSVWTHVVACGTPQAAPC